MFLKREVKIKEKRLMLMNYHRQSIFLKNIMKNGSSLFLRLKNGMKKQR